MHMAPAGLQETAKNGVAARAAIDGRFQMRIERGKNLRFDERLRQIGDDHVERLGEISEQIAATDIERHLVQLAVPARGGDCLMIDIGGGYFAAALRGENCQDTGAGSDIGDTLAWFDPDMAGQAERIGRRHEDAWRNRQVDRACR